MKKLKKSREWHASSAKTGMGDFYGQGIKQKVGRMRQDFMGNISMHPNALKSPPKSLA